MNAISVRGAAEHNLKGFDVDLPRGALVVVAGVSGSGKSSLAFDTIYREAQRRYFETFSSYARQFLGRIARPAVRSITGLSPAIAVDQRTTLRNPRSTVGTLSGLYDDLRLLFARMGAAPDGIRLERRLFSFNSPHGACPACKGLGVEDRLDPDLLVADPSRTIRQGALVITTPTGYVIYSQVTIDVLDQVCRAHGFDVDTPWQALTDAERRIVLRGSDRIRIPYGKHPLASRLRWSGITARPREEGVYKGILPVMEQILARSRNRNILRFVRSLPCHACGGARLRPEALAVRFRERHIGELAALEVEELAEFVGRLDFGVGEAPIGAPIRAEMLGRIGLLTRVGLSHLTLDRASTSLSAGEAQRLRLASQVSSELRGVLYVFDEPSIGLHQSDQARLLDVLAMLRDRGNTVLVVEHDEETLRRADWLIDIGPGAGEHGGELLYSGPVAGVADRADRRSRTRAFLAGDERIPVPSSRRAGSGVLRLTGAARHNLRHVDVEFLRGAFNVITGVSGAGKSSLVEELLAGLERGSVEGGRQVAKVIEIDQSPIGRTPRSNPATYTGLSDAVRDLFAAVPESAARGFGKGRFSFNVVGGRCEACQGAGVQQVGMHFLGQVDVVCDACGGKRFNDETLEVRFRGKSIHDVLEMTLEEAAAFLADTPRAARVLDVFGQLGLGYLRLGQPSTTLSGGEAQRVKLAAELSRPARGHTLYVLDEPTTGLHQADVGVLLTAIERLLGQGHTVVAVEHHLDVVASADRVIDLGPGGGRHGGRLVACGTPESVAACDASLTGLALRGALDPRLARRSSTGRPGAATGMPAESSGPIGASAGPIRFFGVTTHNLKHVDVEIPAGRLTVITGVSGSGKSSLAFDTIFAEGRNRFTESFSAYARRFLEKTGDAEFDRASGLTPAVGIRQRVASRNPRSTVGTMTEIADLYRLLFARIGVAHCPECMVALQEAAGQAGAAEAVRRRREAGATKKSEAGATVPGSASLPPSPFGFGGVNLACGMDTGASTPPHGERRRCPRCGWRGRPTLAASMFSPNTEQGACPTCSGLGTVSECDPDRLVTHPARSLLDGAMGGHRTGRFYGDRHGQHVAILQAVGAALGVDFSVAWQALDEPARHLALHGAGDREFDVDWRYRRGARSGVHRFRSKWLGLVACVGQEYERKHADRRGEALEPLMHAVSCAACHGARLKPESLAVTVAGRNIADLLGLTVTDSLALFRAFDRGGPGGGQSDRALRITDDLRRDVVARLGRLRDAGLGYLALDRLASSLSAGEAQRVRLATEVVAGLTGITYVLDEPTAGLHARDTGRLMGLLTGLRDAGNTVVVVEHDEDVIRSADHVIDLGPSGGDEGGHVVASGPLAAIAGSAASLTGRYLRERGRARWPARRRHLQPGVSIGSAWCHNLRGLDVDIPAGGLVAVTGVSGSGKSTLVFDVLAPALSRPGGPAVDGSPGGWPLQGLRTGAASPAGTARVLVHAPFARVVPAAAGTLRSAPSSVPATIVGVFDRIRDLFAATETARGAGLTRRDFAIGVRGGRCEACEGMGRVRVSMDFLPDVWVPCDECGGRRYQSHVLACRLDGHSIADVLGMTVDHARKVFARERGISGILDVLSELGLGYLRLGQGGDTLSGGERQRLRLAGESVDGSGGPALFLFDEPTTGLHFDDVARLLRVFNRMIDAGHSIVVVEHNVDVIGAADWVIDLGPEGGDGGGQVVAFGTPERIAATEASWTGRALRGPPP